MDVYDALTRIVVEVVALSHGLLSRVVDVPSNASGPLDPNITLTASGAKLVQHMANVAVKTSSILSDTFQTLF